MRVLTTLALTAGAILTATVAVAPETIAAPEARPPVAATSSAEARSSAEDMLARMTLSDKVALLHGEVNPYYGFYVPGNDRLGIPALTMADGPAGVRIAHPGVNDKKATALPAPIALAATFSSDIAYSYGDVIGDEAHKTGHNVSLGTAVDIARVPQAGRTFESYGEDPLLSGSIAASQIAGVQSHAVVADLKHFNVYNQEKNRLFGGNATVDARALHEIYGRPFATAIEQARPGSVMCAFNKVNGTYACENDELLTSMLRTESGFDGWVMSDYGATHSGAKALRAGLDQEQPGNSGHFSGLEAAVANGDVSMEDIDTAVLRILTKMYTQGLFDDPASIAPIDETGHAAISQRIAEESMVLLRNDDDLLPLDDGEVASIAIIGADADTTVAGGGSSLVRPTSSIAPLQAIADRAGTSRVDHAPGSDPVSSAALLPGLDPISSDYLRTAGGAHGVDVQFRDSDGAPTRRQSWPYVALNAGFFHFDGFNANSPHLPELPAGESFGASYSGTLIAPETGTYELELVATGKATVRINGVELLSIDQAGAGQRASGPYPGDGDEAWDPDVVAGSIDLVEGTTYALEVDYQRTVPGWIDAGGQVKLGWRTPSNGLTPLQAEAAQLAENADVAIVVVRDFSSEGGDKPHLDLPNGQSLLIDAVTTANPNTIVVLTTGGPTVMSTGIDSAPAILQAWYGGQHQGAALARILFGDVAPSGKLPVTFPVSEDKTPTSTPEQYPGVDLDARYTEGVFVGYRGYEHRALPVAFPFGHGLSYTDFTYSQVEANSVNGEIVVTFTVKNTGSRTGTEVAQAYIGELPTQAVRTPPKQLAGYERIVLGPGESTKVSIALDRRSLSYWDTNAGGWTMPEGYAEVMVGSSSQDIRGQVTTHIG